MATHPSGGRLRHLLLTFHCAGGLGIWDLLLEVVLAGSAESFLKGWAAGSWLPGLKAEEMVFIRREGAHYNPPPHHVSGSTGLILVGL